MEGSIVRTLTRVILLGATHLLMLTHALALNQSTHEIINRVAAQTSGLDTVLRNNLNLSDGVNQRFRGRPVEDWIGEGGIREDDGVRFFRHFHDPLKPWANAGLTFLGQQQSSIHWMQRTMNCENVDLRNPKEWSWSAARCYFYLALTAPSADDRETAWAHAFRAIGQVMHLVVDASVPEHTRNDPHPLGGLFGSYEYWVQSLHLDAELERAFVATYLAQPVRPDRTLVERGTDDPAAPIPVARLIDTEAYLGVDPNVTLTPAIGIAEFANANFFSEDSGYRRFLAPNYPFPSVETLEPSEHPVPRGSGVRAYYKKGPRDGQPVDPVLAECAMDAAFRDDGIATPQRRCVDQNVWRQTALAMLPRAVGYAAASLEYFFRGRVDARLLPPEAGGSGPRLRIVNPVASGDAGGEWMTGTFSLFYDAVDGTRVPLAEWENQDLAPGTRTEVAIPPPPDGAPPPAEPGRYLLVFRGRLGSEPQAVAASWIEGRVWTLRLGAVTYDRDWTTIPPPTLEPQSFPAGPTYSRSLEPADSTWGFDGSYRARLDTSYTRSRIYPWTCEGPNYSPRLLGAPVLGDQHEYTAWYRGSGVAWGDSATLSLRGYGVSFDGSYTPVVVEVVRFVEPRSPDELASYSYDSPPIVEAVLHEKVMSSPDPIEIGPIALNGAAFVGVRVRPLPAYPVEMPDASPSGPMDYLCFRFLQQYGALPFVGGTPVSAASVAGAELRIPLSP
jgi:hypothetical protein